jgi:serine/threonine protein kinase
MPLAPKSRVGEYEIVAALGAGGMGEVYRARDARIGREVALKILPAAMQSSGERLLRFQQEARAAGGLNHPNLVTIHELGEHDGEPFIVMELLEGETLREKLKGTRSSSSSPDAEGKRAARATPLPLRKALDYARQIAHGLAGAHDKGIVHRDLKPENIFVTEAGRVKLLDFGLAKLRVERPSDDQDAVTERLDTTPGLIIGTVGYMSPEQVRAQTADHRADIFAFGIILYEMLTGRHPFYLDGSVETMNAILTIDPPALATIDPRLPPALGRIVAHCLEKVAAERFQSAHDVAFDLEMISSLSGEVPASSAATSASRRRTTWLMIALVGMAAGAAITLGSLRFFRAPVAPPPLIRSLTYSGNDYDPDLAPDGKTIAFVSERDMKKRIWIKELTTGAEAPLTDGPFDSQPRFSPDGSNLLFLRDENGVPSLFRRPVFGGSPRRVLAGVAGGDWFPDGKRIVAIQRSAKQSVIVIASVDGSLARPIARFNGTSLVWPRVSPDGAWIAISDFSPGNNVSRPVLLSADGKTVRHFEFPRSGTLVSSFAWLGTDALAATQIEGSTAFAGVAGSRLLLCTVDRFDCSVVMRTPAFSGAIDTDSRGRLVFDTISIRQHLSEIDIRDNRLLRRLTRGGSIDRQPAYAPDGRSVFFSSNQTGNLDLWLLTANDASLSRITDDAANDFDPAFSSDGKRLLWSSNRSGHFEVWSSNADGSGGRQITRDGFDAENPTSSPDDEWIAYNSYHPGNEGVWVIRSDGSDARRVVAGSTDLPEFSPDGRLISYHTTDGTNELRVVRVADGKVHRLGAVVARSLGGPASPGRSRWLPDGTRLAFIDVDASGAWKIFVQDVRFDHDTTATRRVLFADDRSVAIESFDIAPDGTRMTISTAEPIVGISIADGVKALMLK